MGKGGGTEKAGVKVDGDAQPADGRISVAKEQKDQKEQKGNKSEVGPDGSHHVQMEGTKNENNGNHDSLISADFDKNGVPTKFTQKNSDGTGSSVSPTDFGPDSPSGVTMGPKGWAKIPQANGSHAYIAPDGSAFVTNKDGKFNGMYGFRQDGKMGTYHAHDNSFGAVEAKPL